MLLPHHLVYIFSLQGKESVHSHLKNEGVSETGVLHVSAKDGFTVQGVSQVYIYISRLQVTKCT